MEGLCRLGMPNLRGSPVILGIADQTPLVGAADERRQQTQEVFETLGRKILTILVAKLS